MKKAPFVALFALFASSLATYASPYSFANTDGYYLTARAGISLASDAEYDTSAGRNGDIGFNGGFNGSFSFGHYLTDAWSIELEYSYRAHDIDQLGGTGNNGDMSFNSIMFNAQYDVALSYDLYWYVGLGLGVSFTDFKDGRTGRNDNDVVFAYQFLTGFGYQIDQNWALVFGYRMFSTFDHDYSIGGANYDVDAPFLHIFEAGLKFTF